MLEVLCIHLVVHGDDTDAKNNVNLRRRLKKERMIVKPSEIAVLLLISMRYSSRLSLRSSSPWLALSFVYMRLSVHHQ